MKNTMELFTGQFRKDPQLSFNYSSEVCGLYKDQVAVTLLQLRRLAGMGWTQM